MAPRNAAASSGVWYTLSFAPQVRPMHRHRRRSLPILLVLGVALLACGPAASAPPASDTDAPAPTAPSTPASAAPTPEPIPSEDLAEFSCVLPVVEQATVAAVTNITDVRIGSHDGYDRVVFEFSRGTPELTLDLAEPPFVQDGSGFPIDVEGDTFFGLVMRGATRQTDSGESSYDGPTDFDPGFDRLVDLVQGGDFEAQSTWYLGIRDAACVRVSLLTDPDRLVIDVEH